MRGIFARIPLALYKKVCRAGKAKDLKFGAVVKQALELWLKDNGA